MSSWLGKTQTPHPVQKIDWTYHPEQITFCPLGKKSCYSSFIFIVYQIMDVLLQLLFIYFI